MAIALNKLNSRLVNGQLVPLAPSLSGFQMGSASLPPEYVAALRAYAANPANVQRQDQGNGDTAPGSQFEYSPGGNQTVRVSLDGGAPSGYQMFDNTGISAGSQVLNGRPFYNYDAGGQLSDTGTFSGLGNDNSVGGLIKSTDPGPFAIAALPFAAAALGLGAGAGSAFSIPSGVAFNPATAAEMAGMGLGPETAATMGAGTAGATAAMGAGPSTGALAEDFTMGGAGGGVPFTPSTAAEVAAMTGGAAGGGLAGGVGSALSGALGGGSGGGFDWTRLIGPAASLVGGAMTAGATGKAADAMLQASREAQALQEPFRQGGVTALNSLLSGLGLSGSATAPGYGALAHDFGTADFQADPGYQFRVSEGEKALQRARAASGSLGSGSYLKDALNFNQGQAAGEYGNAFNRYQVNRTAKINPLLSLMGAGQTAANTIGDYGTQGANATAGGKIGTANALSNSLTQGYSLYANQQQQDQNNALMRLVLGNRGVV